MEDKPKPGRKSGPVNPKLDGKVKQAFNRKKSESIRNLARKLGTSKSNIQRAKERLVLKTYKRQEKLKRSPKQAACVKPRCRKLYDSLFCGQQKCVILDDETYCKFDYQSLPGDQYYTVSEGQDADDAHKSIFTEKFWNKAMVWQAICECGMLSEPFITNQTMNTDVYIRECLSK